MTTTPEEILNDTITKSLRLLRDGFKRDFATFAYDDERMTELLAQLASEFVGEKVPVIDEDNQMELSMMLLESLEIIAR